MFDALSTAPPRSDLTIDIEQIAPTRMFGDEAQLRRLVQNLIDNARRHAATRVTITLTADADALTLHVDDDGAGLDFGFDFGGLADGEGAVGGDLTLDFAVNDQGVLEIDAPFDFDIREEHVALA